jgi:hypothetical protein
MVDCERRGYWAEGLSGEIVAADSFRVAESGT